MTAPAYHTHPDWLAMLAGIRHEPDSDLRRLIVADWLDEHGHGERAVYLRHGVSDGQPRLFGPSVPAVLVLNPDGSQSVGVLPAPVTNRSVYDVSRGFITSVTTPFAHWTAHAPLILPESVGLTVRLTDRPVVEYKLADGPVRGRDQTGRLKARLAGCERWHRVATGGTTVAALAAEWPDVASWEVPEVPEVPGPTDFESMRALGARMALERNRAFWEAFTGGQS